MAEFKQWRNENRTYLKDVIPLDTPFNLKVEASSICNLKCIYCAHSKKNHGVYEGNMSMELMDRILEQSKDFPHKFKVMEMFSFGESLCNPNLEDMICMAKQADVAEKINITTNGLLITKERADKLIDSGVDIIRISLQGIDSKGYEKTCGVKIDFERFVENLKYLYDNRGNTSIRMKIADIAISDIPDGQKRFEEIFGSIADSIFVERIIPMYADMDYSVISSNIYDNAIHGRESIKQDEIHKVCNRPFYRLRVAADGKVTAACCDIPNDFHYGNMNEERLVDIWNGEKRKALLMMQLKGKRFEHPICKTCMIPNDITTEADVLDPWAEEIIVRI